MDPFTLQMFEILGCVAFGCLLALAVVLWTQRHPEPLQELESRRRVAVVASAVFGSRSRGKAWMRLPALALDGRRPIDLLSTSAGTAQVLDLLTRIEHRVSSEMVVRRS